MLKMLKLLNKSVIRETWRRLWVLGICLCSLSAFAADVKRTEVMPIASQLLSDQQLLAGQAGSEANIAGVLRLPLKADNPVVVMLHGSGGYTTYIDHWVELLNTQGIGTLVIDSFSGRGLASVRDDQAQLGRLSSIPDAYAALHVLSKHPLVNPSKIVLMGFSRGGQGALYAAMERMHTLYGTTGEQFAGYVALYPNCNFRYLDDTVLQKVPVRVFHGEADDFNAFAPCEAYVKRAAAAGADIRMKGYPGAWHVFDFSGLPAKLESPKSQSMRNCSVIEKAPGMLINEATGNEFAYTDQCVATGTHVGYLEAAAKDVRTEVVGFLSGLFK